MPGGNRIATVLWLTEIIQEQDTLGKREENMISIAEGWKGERQGLLKAWGESRSHRDA